MQPGLYKNGELVETWDDLIEKEIVCVEGGVLTTGYISEPSDEERDEMTDEEYDDGFQVTWDINECEEYLDGILVLPDDGTIEELGQACFCATRFLEGVKLPSSLKVINVSAFASSGVKELIIPEGVVQIEHNALFNCKNLEFLKLPNSLVYMDFYGMKKEDKDRVRVRYNSTLYKSVSDIERLTKISEKMKKENTTLDSILDDYSYKEINEAKCLEKQDVEINFKDRD